MKSDRHSKVVKRIINIMLLCGLVLTFNASSIFAETIVNTKSEAETSISNANPGDTIILTNGTYNNFAFIISNSGTSGNPITFKSETGSGVNFTGTSGLTIAEDCIVPDGFEFCKVAANNKISCNYMEDIIGQGIRVGTGTAGCSSLSPLTYRDVGPDCLRGEVLIYSEDFNKLSGSFPANGDKVSGTGWWFEGSGSGASASFTNKRLELDANGTNQVGTIWIDHDFPGDLRIEFDVHVLGSVNNSNNMNFFFLFTDKTGNSLYSTRSDRLDGAYGKYHGGADPNGNLTGYIITHLADRNANAPRYRLRDVPPFDPFIAEAREILSADKGQTYHVEVEKLGSIITYRVNNTIIFSHDDNTKNPVHTNGLIGFRTWQTHLWWDNLKVYCLGESFPAKLNCFIELSN